MPSADTTGTLESRLLSEPTRPAVQPLETVAGKLCPTMFPASFPGSQEALLLTQEQGNEEFLKRKENHTWQDQNEGLGAVGCICNPSTHNMGTKEETDLWYLTGLSGNRSRRGRGCCLECG